MAYVGATPARKALTSSDISDGIITAGKIATDAVETVKVKDLNVSTAKLAADAVTNAKTEFTPGLEIKGDGSSAAGKLTLNCDQNTHAVHIAGPAHSAGATYTLTLPTGVGTDGQVLATDGTSSNQLTWVDAQETKPTISSISPTVIDNTQTSIVITGTNFVSVPYVDLVNASTGTITVADSVTFNSATSLTINATLSVDGTYYLRIENNDGNAVRSTTALLTVSDAPGWTTAAGSLGSFAGGSSIGTVNLVATDSTGMTLQSGSFPGGVSLTSGSGTSTLTGTESGSSSTTTYSFTIRATDAEAQTADRAFTITISHGLEQGMMFK